MQIKQLPELIAIWEQSTDEKQQLLVLQQLQPQQTVVYLKKTIHRRHGNLNILMTIKTLESMKQQAHSALPLLHETSLDPNPEVREAALLAIRHISK